ncbi:Leucine-rich repeat,Leucine-rich repeat domain, L domain-like,Leucine-rich repeat, typical subtype [Cinara cedri]|uniref:Leucine-rich repeat,Leucine-rich repeat domain, L domain-like,Leucine-rich repeat, typical subtype n=1 Tax=Cinara cedri TaxID=506608 RepID=A0A5E4NNX3_9HEMI|nr:Leucine-rich repeat,Leucine-rich repeat domain, L domain-like,Leucine-rich repeat, typical subtype [Cinara cedri]
MMPRGKRFVLKESELEEHKKKSSFGHWVLVKECDENRRKNNSESSKAGCCSRKTPQGFAAKNITQILNGATEGFLNVSGKGYLHVNGENFTGELFDRINTVNADDNQLRIATFNTFKSLRRLSLRRNRLKSVDQIGRHLDETLVRLDVSENNLNPYDLYRLSASKIKELHLSANNLTTIPEEILDDHCFLSLELLNLSDNCLACPQTFYILSTLHNLHELNLSGNQISFIPYLVTLATKKSLDIENISGKNKKTINHKKETDGFTKHQNEDNTNSFVYHVQHIPFVSLKAINLTNNLITSSSSVLSMICWPSLKNVILTANIISSNKNILKYNKLKSTLSVYEIKLTR